VTEAPQQWLGGYRATGRRRLDEAEAGALLVRLRGELRPLRRAHLVSRWSVALISLGIGTYFMFRPDPSPAITVFAALGVMLLVLGPVGALLEIAFAPGFSRVFFLCAGALTALAVWMDPGGSQEGPWMLVGLLSGAGVVVGGLLMLFSRWSERPRRIQALGHGVVDVHRGEVLVFEPAQPPSTEPENQEGEEEHEEYDEPMARQLEVLPTSKLLYRVDEVLSRDLRVTPVISMAPPGPDGSPGTSRELSAPEREELGRAHARLRRQGISEVLGTTWLIAIVLRAIENLLRGNLDPRLSGASWLVTLACGIVLAIRRTRWQRRLGADVRTARVERVAGPGATVVELLPTSRLLWSAGGCPAPWRVGIQD
jgi:hypothetical protein